MGSSPTGDSHGGRRRARSALSVYPPSAKKIFGSYQVGLWLRYCFVKSLALSRLMFDVHTWVMTPQALGSLSNVYMRVLRRIAGEARFSDACAMEDVDVCVAILAQAILAQAQGKEREGSRK